MSPRRPASLLAVAALTLGVSACSGDPEPIIASPSPSPTSSESATPSPTDDPRVVPGDETAEEFIRRWQEENLAMQTSGMTAVFRAMSRDCQSCDQLADRVEEVYESGGSITVDSSRLIALTRVGQSENPRIFEFSLKSGRTRITNSSGEVIQEFSGGEEQFQMTVDRLGGRWQVLRYSRLAS